MSAQTTFATITGTVNDATGAVIPGVTVIARHLATGFETTTQSNDAGIYTLAQLREGEYAVTARGAGFKEHVTQNIVLVARDYRRVDITLEVGAVETRVEVTAAASLIETETARISDTKTADLLKSIPLNTRGIWAFLSLSPNVLQAGGGSSTIRFAGSRGNQSHWAIDGTTMSDGVDETQIGPLANYIESFQEIKIDMSNNTAEFGTIGQVTMISKSGTNNLHGNVFDYYSTPWFRARDPFAPARGTGISHTPGGSVGGPVFLPRIYNGKDKTFFFFSFETSRGSAVQQLLNPTVPLESWRDGDFSSLGTTIRDPSTGEPFPNNVIPADRINPVARNIQDRFYPLPNFGNASALAPQNYRELKVRPRDPSTYWTARGDHRFSDKDSLFGRFTFQRAYNRPYEGNLPTIGQRFQRRDNRAASVAYTHTFSPSLLNEFRWGFALNNNPIEGPLLGNDVVRDLGLTGLVPDLPDVSGIFKVNWTGVGLTPITQVDYRRPGFRNFLMEFQEHLSWFRGRHNFKAGFNLTRVEWDDGAANPNLFGTHSYSNRYSGYPYADFLLGLPTTAARAFPFVVVDRLRWQYDLFFQDDFKIHRNLTLNLGFRYEYHPVWREEHGRSALFDIGSGRIVVPDGSMNLVSPLMPTGYVDVVEASAAGLPSETLIRSDRNNFLPRIGLAYRPFGERTVIRSGFGVFYDVVPRNITQGGIPYVINEPNFTNPAGNPLITLPQAFPSTGTGGPTTVGLPAAVNPDLQIPYSMQWNLTLEHSRWDTGFRLSYIGTNTRKGDYSYNYNSPAPDARPFIEKPRPFPEYPAISYFTNGAGHQFHGLTTEVERNMKNGLYYQFSWALARDIGDLERGAASENPFDRQRERAVALDIPTHRVTMNWMYQLPFGRGRPFLSSAGRSLNLLVGGWDLSGIYSYYSGQFLTPLWTGPDPTGTAFTASATPAEVTIRPDHLRDANLPSDQRSVGRWFDVGAFAPPQLGRFGTSAKGVIKGPWVNVWHLGLFKSFFLSETALLRWELTATNAFNHPNWSNPAVNISQAQQVGVISGVGGVNGSSTGDQPFARAFRMGLRLEF
ncbi:MAG: carboxypeptidase regulatory-like domain-containing protein [Bryobacteraceae bacterium]|nr:carboxypeptidase regulatory-like domain-containing protein [Bryobacteraceae bacterium]